MYLQYSYTIQHHFQRLQLAQVENFDRKPLLLRILTVFLIERIKLLSTHSVIKLKKHFYNKTIRFVFFYLLKLII